MAYAPVETKVTVSSLSAAATSYVVGLVIMKWSAFDSLSEPLSVLVLAGFTAAFTLAAGWLAKHTPRRVQDVALQAVAAYEAYGRSVNGLNHYGEPMPSWDALPDATKRAWIAATETATEPRA